MTVYEFAKGFQETQNKNGLWVSGGFAEPIARSNYSGQLPEPIQDAVIGKLFEIPKRYRPNPGAEALINQGYPDKIAQPDLNSIALIAREIEHYCVLAVATSQIDDRGRDLLVGYRYFWLDVKDIINQRAVQDPDGILILLKWWLRNGNPCFNMNPNSSGVTNNQLELYQKQEIETIERTPIFYELLSQVELDFPPFLIDIDKEPDRIPINSTQIEEVGSSLMWLHYLALKANKDYEDCPLAWAWNIRGLGNPRESHKSSSHLGDFAAICCADSDALELITKQKQLLPKKGKKISTPCLPPASQLLNNSDRETSADTETDPPSKISNPDPLEEPKDSQEKIKNKIGKHIDIYVKYLKQNQLKEVLRLYKYNLPLFEKIMENKMNLYKDINNIKTISEMRYISLLIILICDKPEKMLSLEKIKLKNEVIYFLNELLQSTKKLKKDSSENHNFYSQINSRIVRLLNPYPYSHRENVIEHINPSNLNFSNPIEWFIQLFAPSDTPDNASHNESSPPAGRPPIDPPLASSSMFNDPPITHSSSIKSPRLPIFFIRLLIAAVLALIALIVGTFISPSHVPIFSFLDIESHWANKYIQALAEKKIITVSENRKYDPDSPMTRAEFATILTKAFPVKSENTSFPFTDVNNDHWAYQAIKDVYSSGFFAGSEDGRFYPDQSITRLAILQTLVKALKLSDNHTQNIDLSFYQDENQINDDARNTIALAIKEGLVINYSKPCLLEPKREATRAEAATMLYQSLIKANKADPIDFPESPELNLESRICHIQKLEAGTDNYLNPELMKARKNLIQWMEKEIRAYLAVLKENTSTEESKKSVISKIKQDHSYFESLTPHLWEESNIPKTIQIEDNDETVKNLKENLTLLNFYSGSIDSIFDDTLKQVIADFQNQNDILSEREKQNRNDGIVGPKTWKALTQIFQDAQLIAAYEYIIQGLEANKKVSEIIKQLKECKKKGPLAYVTCVKENKSKL